MSRISKHKVHPHSNVSDRDDFDKSQFSIEESKTKYSVFNTWNLYSTEEKKNIAIYICGIMLYKFGLEAFNGSIIALATNRYDYDAQIRKVKPKTFQQTGVLTGLNQAFQCVGSILIAPLIKRFPTRSVLSFAILLFGLLTALLLIVDAATGGRIKPKDWSKTHKKDDFSYYGTYNTDGMIPIYCVTGIAYGMVELIRRVIPRDIVGGDVQKLRRMDALVHIFYEVAGTGGAFCTALGLIPYFGNNMSFIITPICFTAAAVIWFFISTLNFNRTSLESMAGQPAYIRAVLLGFKLFFKSIYIGAKIIFTDRRYIWLVPGYSFALYGHRYLENGIAPALAKRYFGNSAWSQIMVGGSNFGEFLGALFVFLFTNLVHTPMPWLRLDAVVLLIVWYLAFWQAPYNTVSAAWMVAATFVPVSFGWAAGDVSLAAYIQALLQREESNYDDVSPLGAVMAFLYSTYIIIYAVMSPLLGRYIDSVSARNNRDIHDAVFNIAGVQFTVLAVVIIASTFIPQGSWAFNPKAISGDTLTDARWSDEHVNRPPTSEDGFIDTDGDAKPVRGRRS